MYLKSNLKFFIGVAVGAIVVAGTFIGKPLKAATGDPTGSCGALMDISYKNVTPTAGSGYGANVLMLVNFDTLKINARSNVNTHNTADWKTTTASSTLGPISFTLSAGPFANTYIITPAADSGVPTFGVVSVNSGNTFLLQAQNDRGTGVCQKI